MSVSQNEFYRNPSQNVTEIPQFYSPYRIRDGIYLVRRKSIVAPTKDHCGFAVVGKHLGYFNTTWSAPVVIHKTNTGVQYEIFDFYGWEILERMNDQDLPSAVFRTAASLDEKYDLLFSNCEHFARFVVTGNKESTQVQSAVGWAFVGIVTLLWLRGDN